MAYGMGCHGCVCAYEQSIVDSTLPHMRVRPYFCPRSATSHMAPVCQNVVAVLQKALQLIYRTGVVLGGSEP